MSNEIEVTETVIAAVSEQCPEVTTEQVAMVLTAWNVILEGEPVGTIKQDPATGNLAIRVSEDGIHKWKVTSPAGGQWSDLQSTLPGWVKLT